MKNVGNVLINSKIQNLNYFDWHTFYILGQAQCKQWDQKQYQKIAVIVD